VCRLVSGVPWLKKGWEALLYVLAGMVGYTSANDRDRIDKSTDLGGVATSLWIPTKFCFNSLML